MHPGNFRRTPIPPSKKSFSGVYKKNKQVQILVRPPQELALSKSTRCAISRVIIADAGCGTKEKKKAGHATAGPQPSNFQTQLQTSSQKIEERLSPSEIESINSV
jgi:hypothetical protein